MLVKRVFDLGVSAIALVVLAPLLFVVAVAVRLSLGSPILFRQVRPGRGGVPFELVKFRTMTDSPSPEPDVSADRLRLTPFGRFLRATTLDELPQLWNVLRGDMSLVGPRPLLLRYLDRYTPEQARRHEVRPGLTGWAQVKGRNALSWEEKFALDIWYVEHRTFWLDLRILLMTLVTVMRTDGITGEGSATMQEFMGSTPDPPATAERGSLPLGSRSE